MVLENLKDIFTVASSKAASLPETLIHFSLIIFLISSIGIELELKPPGMIPSGNWLWILSRSISSIVFWLKAGTVRKSSLFNLEI